jgi:AraC-like DNA-binding protein
MQVRSQSVGPLLALVRQRGGDPVALSARFGLDESAEAENDVAITVPALKGLFDAAAEAIGDADLGLHAALSLQRGRYGLVEYATFSAPTLWQGMERLVRFSALINRAAKYELTRAKSVVRVTHRVPGFADGLGRQANEFGMLSLLQMARAAVHQRFAPLRVWFSHRAPASLSELHAHFGTSAIDFGADSSGLELEAALTDAPIPTADAYLLGLVDKYATLELASLPADESLAARARLVIRAQVEAGAPKVTAVAAELRMSARTLQRRLASEGVPYQRLVDAVREDVARAHLAHGTSLGEIAFRLGYSDMGSFLRAFKRWTGITPAAFRKSAMTRRAS